MKDYIVKTRGLCELSEIAEILSIVNIMVFRLFIYKVYLFDSMKTRVPWTNYPHKFKETEDITSTRHKGFL